MGRRCYVLVDSVRGLCEEDKVLLRFLQQKQIPWKVSGLVTCGITAS